MSKSEFTANLELTPIDKIQHLEINHHAIKALAELKAKQRRERLLAIVVWTSAVLVATAVCAVVAFTR